jgi:predicted acyltransferase
MFWIIGGDEIAGAIKNRWPNPVVTQLCQQFSEHVSWVGFRYYDMIFPLFLFIIGATLPFSLGRRLEEGAPRGELVRKVLMRSAILFLLGMVYNGLLHAESWEHVRIFGVLQRQALGYGAAALLMLYVRPRNLIFVAVGILLFYWAIMALIPVPGYGRGDYSEWGNVANYVDRLVLRNGQMYEVYGDPEGLLSTIPAVTTALLGLFAGLWLKSERPGQQKVVGLVIGGLVLVGLGLLWASFFPVIKKIWTSSYTLVAGGASAVLLGLFYGAVDVLNWKKAAFPLVVIGMNAITIYLLKEIIDFGHVSEYFLGGVVKGYPDLKELILACGAVAAEWLVLWFLYKKQVFLRV